MPNIPEPGPSPFKGIYTIGHSTRTLKEFLTILRAWNIERLVDVRTLPRSRHNPQFNADTLSRFLRNRRIGYLSMKALGGLRHARKDSINLGWVNSSFRGFADYMQTSDFEKALSRLIDGAKMKTTVLLCAEAVPWRCHRFLIADALLVRGIPVRHIFSGSKASEHVLIPWARVKGHRITYPPASAGIARDGKV